MVFHDIFILKWEGMQQICRFNCLKDKKTYWYITACRAKIVLLSLFTTTRFIYIFEWAMQQNYEGMAFAFLHIYSYIKYTVKIGFLKQLVTLMSNAINVEGFLYLNHRSISLHLIAFTKVTPIHSEIHPLYLLH